MPYYWYIYVFKIKSNHGDFFLDQRSYFHQEQRNNDPKVIEIRLRFDVLKMVANDAEVSPEANAEVASRVIRILSEDVYFADASLVAENIQTIGYMKMVRANLELLQTGDQAHHISFMGSWDG